MNFRAKSIEVSKLQWKKLDVNIHLEYSINNHDKIPFLILIIYVYIYVYAQNYIF